MHYCDHVLSVVRRPSVVRCPSSLTFHIFDFSSETAEQNLTELYRKVDFNVLYQVCVFRADQKIKMAALASDGLKHFRLLLWNRWTEFNETWYEARSQRLLPSLCFLGRSEKQVGRPGLWLAEAFSTSPLKPLNGIQRNLTGSKISTSSTKFVFFGPIGKTRWPPWPLIGWDIFDFSPESAERNSMKLIGSKISTSSTKFVFFGQIGKTRWPPWPLIGWDIFDFSSETAERNSKKLDRKQGLNVLYQVPMCFSGRSEKQDDRPGLWLAETFSTYPLKPLNGIQRNLIGSKISNVLLQVCVFRADRKNRWPHWQLIGWDIFDLSSEITERNSTKLDRNQDLNFLYQVCVFRADWKNKMAALASDWLRHFRLLLWNRWTEFNESYMKARSQHPLLSLCFSGWSEKQNGCPGLSLAEIIRLFLRNQWTEFNESWQEPRSQLPLQSLQVFLANQ